MATTFCGQEHLPLKWGIFSQNPLKCVGSKTLEIRCTGNGTVGSNPTRSAKSSENYVFCMIFRTFSLLKNPKHNHVFLQKSGFFLSSGVYARTRKAGKPLLLLGFRALPDPRRKNKFSPALILCLRHRQNVVHDIG